MHAHTHPHVPWFLRAPPDMVGGATLAVVSWATVLSSDARGTMYLGTDVPLGVFLAMIERAARHDGYKGCQRDIREIVAGDVCLSIAQQQQHEQQQQQHFFACERKALCEVREMPGTPLVVRTYRRERLPFAAFPCDAVPDRTSRVRRLELRVHGRARLVFDVAAGDDGDQGGVVVVRSARLEIDLIPRGFSHTADGRDASTSDWDDLRRTTENTIQNVFLGMKPRRPPRGGVA